MIVSYAITERMIEMVRRDPAIAGMSNADRASQIASRYDCDVSIAKAALVQKTIQDGDYEGLAFWSRGVSERVVDNVSALVNIFENTDSRFRFLDEPSEELCKHLEEIAKNPSKKIQKTDRDY